MIEACCRTLSRVVQAIKVQRPNPTPAVGQRCPSAVQALSKHCPSSVQAGHFRVQARLECTSDPLGFCHFEVTKSPPKCPYYNIKRGQHIKKGAGEGRWCSTGQRSRILQMPVRVRGVARREMSMRSSPINGAHLRTSQNRDKTTARISMRGEVVGCLRKNPQWAWPLKWPPLY